MGNLCWAKSSQKKGGGGSDPLNLPALNVLWELSFDHCKPVNMGMGERVGEKR